MCVCLIKALEESDVLLSRGTIKQSVKLPVGTVLQSALAFEFSE